MVKILLQQIWQQRIDWDDDVPQPILETWLRWRSELNLLTSKTIPRCYYAQGTSTISTQIHGFYDASEAAYAAVVYVRSTNADGGIYTSLVIAKTKVAPIKRLTIPRLELCGAHMLAKLLHHVRNVLSISLDNVYAWTDSTIVISWLTGDPNHFKTYVANRVSDIIEHIPPKCWRHVNGIENPADCASRGILPSELMDHSLWWYRPHWLSSEDHSDDWPKTETTPITCREEEREISLAVMTQPIEPLFTLKQYSSFERVKRVTAWIIRFINNCRYKTTTSNLVYTSSQLTVKELSKAEVHWWKTIQAKHFRIEIELLQNRKVIERSSCLSTLNPILDRDNVMRVGGRQSLSGKPYKSIHQL